MAVQLLIDKCIFYLIASSASTRVVELTPDTVGAGGATASNKAAAILFNVFNPNQAESQGRRLTKLAASLSFFAVLQAFD